MDFEIDNLLLHLGMVSVETPLSHHQIEKKKFSEIDAGRELKFSSDAMVFITQDDVQTDQTLLSIGTETKEFDGLGKGTSVKRKEVDGLVAANNVTKDGVMGNKFPELDPFVCSPNFYEKFVLPDVFHVTNMTPTSTTTSGMTSVETPLFHHQIETIGLDEFEGDREFKFGDAMDFIAQDDVQTDQTLSSIGTETKEFDELEKGFSVKREEADGLVAANIVTKDGVMGNKFPEVDPFVSFPDFNEIFVLPDVFHETNMTPTTTTNSGMTSVETPLFHHQIEAVGLDEIEGDREFKFGDAMDFIAQDDVQTDQTLSSIGTETKEFDELGKGTSIKHKEVNGLVAGNIVTKDIDMMNVFPQLKSRDVSEKSVQTDDFNEINVTKTITTKSGNSSKGTSRINPCSSKFRKQKEIKMKKRKKIIPECPSCGKIVSSLAHLELHFRIHTGEKPHICPVCSTRFRQKYHLVNHISCLHRHSFLDDNDQWIASHRCYFCPFNFDTKWKYKTHISRKHSDLL